MTRIDHSTHDHPATPAARKACRDNLNGVEMTATEMRRLSDFHATGRRVSISTPVTSPVNTPAPTVSTPCTGPNKACRAAHRAGRSVHIIPEHDSQGTILVLPTYHYATESEARQAVTDGWATAIVIRTDEDLYAARKAGQPHLLVPGWVDPTCRNRNWVNPNL